MSATIRVNGPSERARVCLELAQHDSHRSHHSNSQSNAASVVVVVVDGHDNKQMAIKVFQNEQVLSVRNVLCVGRAQSIECGQRAVIHQCHLPVQRYHPSDSIHLFRCCSSMMHALSTGPWTECTIPLLVLQRR